MQSIVRAFLFSQSAFVPFRVGSRNDTFVQRSKKRLTVILSVFLINGLIGSLKTDLAQFSSSSSPLQKPLRETERITKRTSLVMTPSQ